MRSQYWRTHNVNSNCHRTLSILCTNRELTSTQRPNIKCYFDRWRSTFFEFRICGLCALARVLVVAICPCPAVRSDLDHFESDYPNFILPCISHRGFVKLNSHSYATKRMRKFIRLQVAQAKITAETFYMCASAETGESLSCHFGIIVQRVDCMLENEKLLHRLRQYCCSNFYARRSTKESKVLLPIWTDSGGVGEHIGAKKKIVHVTCGISLWRCLHTTHSARLHAVATYRMEWIDTDIKHTSSGGGGDKTIR